MIRLLKQSSIVGITIPEKLSYNQSSKQVFFKVSILGFVDVPVIFYGFKHVSFKTLRYIDNKVMTKRAPVCIKKQNSDIFCSALLVLRIFLNIKRNVKGRIVKWLSCPIS